MRRLNVIMALIICMLTASISISQILEKKIKTIMENAFGPCIDECYNNSEMNILLSQPSDKMLPIYEDLLYGRIDKYNFTAWNIGQENAKNYYRKGAANMLAKMKKSEALEILRKWLDEQIIYPEKKKYDYRELLGINASINAIADYRKPEDIIRLEKWINHPDWGLRVSLANAFGKIECKRSVEMLHKMLLNDSNLAVRIEAIKSLKNFGDESVLSDLKAYYADQDSFSHPNDKKIIKETIDAIEGRILK
jgi:HEAT repeats